MGHYCIHFTYDVAGTNFDGMTESPVDCSAGSTFPIRFNPKDPRRNAADPAKGFPISYMIAALLLVAILYVLFEVRR
jgi:hypothetical protein